MKRTCFLWLAILLSAVTSKAQNPVIHPQKAVMHGGIPAVECRAEAQGKEFVWAIERVELNGKSTFRIPVADFRAGGSRAREQDYKRGTLRITADRIAFDADPSDKNGPFVESRTALSIQYGRGEWWAWLVQAGGRTWEFYPYSPGSDTAVTRKLFPECAKLLDVALSDFEAAQREFNRLTASLRSQLRITSRPENAQVYVDGEPRGTTSADHGELTLENLPPGPHNLKLTAAGYKDWTQRVTLTSGDAVSVNANLVTEVSQVSLLTQPNGVQVYVDDVFRGMTSAEGRLVVEGLTPGAHRVRMNLIGYTEAARTVDLKPGETVTIEAKLEPAGPKALALAEIEEALTNGISAKRLTTLVNQYGVDFALTKSVEQGLREKGADSDLLVAIATNKK